MKRSAAVTLLAMVLFPLLNQAAGANPPVGEEIEIGVQVSPNTIILSLDERANGDVRITVHTDIDYSAVVTSTVQLGGFDAILTKADACGDLVAKFSHEDVETLVEVGEAVLVLTGELEDGNTFRGVDRVRVVN